MRTTRYSEPSDAEFDRAMAHKQEAEEEELEINTENIEQSTPTPETDAAWADKSRNILALARKLERERDELREQNRVFRAAQKACEDCDAATNAEVQVMRAQHEKDAACISELVGVVDAMRSAIIDTHKSLLRIYLSDIHDVTMRQIAETTIANLQPFLTKP
jgi:chromosome segregation ATPase